MTVALLIAGVAAIVYGTAVMLVGSGTLFHLVWFGIGAFALTAAAMVATGAWETVPVALRRTVGVVVSIVAIAVLASGAIVASGMGARAGEGLDYLVVLGAQVREDGPSNVLRYRLDAAYDYLVANPGTKAVVSGGQGPNEPWPEAKGMAEYLAGRGIDRARIIEEGTSTSTLENLSNSLALIEEDGGSAASSRVGIVTNGFHVYRARATAVKVGYGNVCGIAAYSTPAYLPNNLLREALGLIKDFLVQNI